MNIALAGREDGERYLDGYLIDEVL